MLIKVGRGGNVEYNVTATSNGAAMPGAASYLASAIDRQASNAVPNSDAQPGAPADLLDKKHLLIAGAVALFLLVFLFAAKKL
jgi:hypothetical protein